MIMSSFFKRGIDSPKVLQLKLTLPADLIA